MDTGQFISHTQTALIDTVVSLQGSESVVIPASEVHELLTKIHDILDDSLSKCSYFAYLFNSTSRQGCEVWASQFPFLHNIKDSINPSEACLYGCINWSLSQTHHQSSHGLSQSSTSIRGIRAKSRAGFCFDVQKCSVLKPGGASWPNKPHLDPKSDGHQGGRTSLGGA